MAPSCDQDDCEAELTDTTRVGAVDGEYNNGRAVGRYSGACSNGHVSTWDELEG